MFNKKLLKCMALSIVLLQLTGCAASTASTTDIETTSINATTEDSETTESNETTSELTSDAETSKADETTTEAEVVTEEPTLSEVVSKEGTINGIHYEIGDGEYYNARFDEPGYTIDTENRPNAPYYYFISAGTKYSGGYSISVVDVDIDTDKNAYITVSEKSPGPEDIVTDALTYPYCVVIFSELPKSVKIVGDDGYEYEYLDGIADPETSETEEDTTEIETEAVTTTVATTVETSTTVATTAAETSPTAAVVPVSIEATVNGSYYLGDTLKASDFTIKVTYSDGSVVPNPAGWSASNLSLNSASNGIVISYGGLQTTVSVPASERPTVAPTEAPTVAPTQAPTTAPTTVAPTTVAPTTQAPTTAAPTTVAPTTEAPPVITMPTEPYWDREAALHYFDLQNADRVAHGVPALVWDEELYQMACNASKAVGDQVAISGFEIFNNHTAHSYSDQYTLRHITGVSGYEYDVYAAENLSVTVWGDNGTSLWNAITDSPNHYETATYDGFDKGSVAVYYSNGYMVASALFWDNEEYLYW